MGHRGLICGLWLAAALSGQDLEPGRIIEKVECRSKAQQSYALYIPSTYSKVRKWPVLYCFDPRARGRAPVERFLAAAERLGIIVAGSNNSRNGPMPPIAEALQAMVEDSEDRLSIDPDRIYAAGFSGGGQVAAHWAANGRLAGIVLCGATIDPSTLPARPSFRVYGSAGVDDFAYYEMYATSVALAKRDVPNRFREFAGGHEWLPADAAEEALRFLAGELPAAPAADSTDIAEKKARLESVVAKISQAGNDSTQRRVTEFRTQPDGSSYPASVAARNGDSMANVAGLPQDDAVRQSPAQLVADLLKESEKPTDSPKRRLARQALTSAYISNTQWAGQLMDARNYREAARCLEVAVLVRPKDGRAWYSLAVARAAASDKGKALTALKNAASNGFRDVAGMERERFLDSIRDDRKYAAVVQTMKSQAQ